MTPIPSEAREEIEKLERKHAENPDGRYFVPLANAYRKLGEVDRATDLLRDGLRRHPDYLSAHIVLGRCLADRREVEAAEAEFRHVLSIDPQNLIALRTLGEMALSAGKVEEGTRWYRQLLAVDPMNDDALRALATGPAADSPPPSHLGERRPEGDDSRLADDHELYQDVSPDPHFDAGEGDAHFPFADEGNAVVTETIAELYTRQGFYDRAADVYRELIRRRGRDPGLEDRLRRVEDLASPETAALSRLDGEGLEQVRAHAPELEQEPEEADRFADSFVGGFPPTPAGSEGAATIRQYLQDVLAWTPAETPVAAAPPLVEEPALSASETLMDQPVPDAPGSPPADWFFEPSPSELRLDDFGEVDEPAPALPLIHAEDVGAEEADEELPLASDDDLFPWEIPTPVAAAEPPGPVEGPARDLPAPGVDDLAPVEASAPPTGEMEPPPTAGPSAPLPAGAEDEDLESFQAWLRSLKR